MMPRQRTDRPVWGYWRLACLLSACLLLGCSSPPGTAEPSPHDVERQLREVLDKEYHLSLTEFRAEGEGHYVGEAKSVSGANYRVTATTEGRRLTYQAEEDNLFPTGGPGVLRGSRPLREPSFDERHPEAMQWLRAVACGVHTVGVIWPLLGAFGWRRRYSPRVERALTVFAVVNLGFAFLWGYQFVTNLAAAA